MRNNIVILGVAHELLKGVNARDSFSNIKMDTVYNVRSISPCNMVGAHFCFSNMKQPKVSIIIPCYNSEAFLAETLQSCINQQYPNTEIIVVDDGSTDGSLQIARQWEGLYDQIHVYHQANSGACRARNLGFEKSSGKYIMYLDADDIINPSYLEEHIVRLQEANERCISFGKWDKFKSSTDEAIFPNRYYYKDYANPFTLLIDLWETGGMLQTSCYMVSRSLVNESGGWNENLLMNQDGEFFSRILMIASKACFVNKAKVYYRTGEYSTVSKPNSEKKLSSLLDSYINYKENALIHKDTPRVRRALSYNFTYFIYLYGNKYPVLYRRAKEQVVYLGVGFQLRKTSPRVRLISKIIGFENLMALRKFISKE